MPFILSRRHLLIGTGALLAAGSALASAEGFKELEIRHGGRLGVSALDTGTGRTLSYREDERFPLCSTFKTLLAAAFLVKIDKGQETLDRPIRFGPDDIMAYAPVAKQNLARGAMTVEEMCEAAVSMSDNTAANLLLEQIGGPPAVTELVRGFGDRITRLDRNEPSLNDFTPSDPRDTTTPKAAIEDYRALILGEVLSKQSRTRLTGWLVGCKTGDARLRKGLPAGWLVGDKTGTNPEQGSANDVAIVWPPERKPWLIAAYYTGSKAPGAERDSVLAEVARIVAIEFQPG